MLKEGLNKLKIKDFIEELNIIEKNKNIYIKLGVIIRSIHSNKCIVGDKNNPVHIEPFNRSILTETNMLFQLQEILLKEIKDIRLLDISKSYVQPLGIIKDKSDVIIVWNILFEDTAFNNLGGDNRSIVELHKNGIVDTIILSLLPIVATK